MHSVGRGLDHRHDPREKGRGQSVPRLDDDGQIGILDYEVGSIFGSCQGTLLAVISRFLTCFWD